MSPQQPLHTGYRRALSLRNVAVEVGLSQRQMSRRFVASTLMTVMECMHLFRIEHAKQLLANRQLSIKQIAAEVGYSRTSRLDFHFKCACGVRPTDYRQALPDNNGEGGT